MDAVHQPFLLYALRLFEEEIAKKGTGSTFGAINRGDLLKLPIPLPSVSEQKRISAILTEQLAAVEQARKASEARLEAARALPAAYLREVFESEEAQRWSIKKIGDLARVQSGYAFKSTWFAEGGIRLLRNANVFQGYIDWSDSVHLPAERRHEFPTYELSAGDIVLSLDRPIVKAGLKIARLMKTDAPALLLQRVGRFVLTEAVDPGYLYAFLNSSRFIGAIVGHDYSIGVPHISPGQVEAVEIPCPPLSAQRCIAANLQKITKAINEQLLLALVGERDALHELPASLLRQAFSGGL